MPIVFIAMESVKSSSTANGSAHAFLSNLQTRYAERLRSLLPCDVPCIHCGHPLTHGNGSYPRRPFTWEGVREEWDIHRRYCPQCGRTFGLLPAHLAPFARYTIDVQDAAVRAIAQGSSYEQAASNLATQGVSVDTPALRRWFHRVRLQIGQMLPTLSALLQRRQPQRTLPPLRNRVRDAAVCGYYDRLPLLGGAPHSGSWNVLRRLVCLFAPSESANRVSYGLHPA